MQYGKIQMTLANLYCFSGMKLTLKLGISTQKKGIFLPESCTNCFIFYEKHINFTINKID